MGLLDRVLGRTKPSETPWVTYRSQAGFYSVQYPADWLQTIDGNVVNISPPDRGGAVTISPFHGTPPTADFPERWLADTFEKDEPLSDREAISRNGWRGFRQGFMSAGADPRAWVGIVAVREPVFVLITANDVARQFHARAATYGRIMESLQIHTPHGAA